MEGVVIRSLEFRLTVPTHYKFLVRYIKAAQCDTRTKLIAYYFCEKCMPEFSMLEFKPSVIASAAVLLALKASDQTKSWLVKKFLFPPPLFHFSHIHHCLSISFI